MDKAVAALEAGTLDCRDDATLTWMPLRLDDEGWAEVTTIMEEANDRILAVQARSRARLAGPSGGQDRSDLRWVVALAQFETGGSPRRLARAGAWRRARVGDRGSAAEGWGDPSLADWPSLQLGPRARAQAGRA